MSYRNFMLLRILIIIAIGFLIAWSTNTGNAWLPVPTVIAGFVILLLLHRRVKEVIVDERIYRIADKAAQKAFRIFGILAALTGAILVALSQQGSPTLLWVGLTLAYATAALVLLYYIFYTYYNRKMGGGE